MPFCWDKKKMQTNKINDTSNMISDFSNLKLSVLKKASHISSISHNSTNDRVTIGPQSVLNNLEKNNSDKLENIENEQNSCNIKTPQEISNNPKCNTSPSNVYFSMQKILLEKELQRKEEVKQKIQRHIQNMKENDRAIQAKMANSRSNMAREREQRTAEKLANILAEEERIAEQEEIKRQHEQQLQAQRLQEQMEKNKRELEEYRRRMKEKEELTKAVMTYRVQFTNKYSDIAAISKACKDMHAFNEVLTANMPRLRELIQQFETLNEKIKSGELGITDVNFIETLVHHMDDMLNIFRTEIEKIDAQYEAELAKKAQAANEVQQDEDNAVKNLGNENSKITNQKTTVASNAIDVSSASYTSKSISEEVIYNLNYKTEDSLEYNKQSVEICFKNQQFLTNYRDTYKEFLNSPTTKKLRFECQKEINIPVNAISSTSEEHLKDKYDRLANLLNGKSANVMQHPQGVFFCKDHLAKKIVNQGETLVSSKPEMAFPIAAIVVALWNEHTDFGELFLAHLHKACPFTIPIFLQQEEGQSNEDYYKSLGCKYLDDGSVESQDKFLRRMSGLIRLYASITITRQRKNITKTHPHGLQHTWKWLSAVLNIKPRIDTCDLCATLILDILEVTGHMLWITYSKQFHKTLILLKQEYFPYIQDKTGGNDSGPLVRLNEFLNNALANNTIRSPKGLLPPKFW